MAAGSEDAAADGEISRGSDIDAGSGDGTIRTRRARSARPRRACAAYASGQKNGATARGSRRAQANVSTRAATAAETIGDGIKTLPRWDASRSVFLKSHVAVTTRAAVKTQGSACGNSAGCATAEGAACSAGSSISTVEPTCTAATRR